MSGRLSWSGNSSGFGQRAEVFPNLFGAMLVAVVFVDLGGFLPVCYGFGGSPGVV